jgi:hypothetical protein
MHAQLAVIGYGRRVLRGPGRSLARPGPSHVAAGLPPYPAPPPAPPPGLPAGFSLAYNSGSALGGTAPAIVSAIQIAVKAQPLAWQLAPGIWISCLAALAAAAATGLLWAAPLVNRSGRRGGGHRAGACEMAAA